MNKMLQLLAVGLLLWPILLLSTSCATQCGTVINKPSMLPILSVEKIPETEPYEEGVDAACAYFYYLWGKVSELDQKHSMAIAAYQKALICDSRAYHVMRSLARILIKTGEHYQALAILDKMFALKPDDIHARFLLANLYMTMDKSDEALRVYQEILAVEPENLDVLLLLGVMYGRNEQYNEAMDLFRRLVTLDPESYAGHYYLAKLYKELELFDKAFASYDKSLTLNWSTIIAFEAAALYEQQQMYNEAIELYNHILLTDELNTQARALLANLYLRKNDPDSALYELKKLRDLIQDDKKINFTIGRILLDQGSFDEAIVLFSYMLKENPGFYSARSMLIMAYYQMGDMENAKQFLRQVQPATPGYEKSVLMLVKILRNEKNIAAAKKVLLRNIADDTLHKSSFYMALAVLYQEQGKMDEAQQLFIRAISNFPDESGILFEYGMFLERIGDYDAALSTMKEVLKREPDNPYALNHVGYTWADNNINLEQAHKYIKKAVALRPKNGFIRDSLGWVLYRLGDFEQAVIELEKAVELAPNHPIILEHLGDAYMQIDKPQKALYVYTKAFALEEDEGKREQINKKIQSIKATDHKRYE